MSTTTTVAGNQADYAFSNDGENIVITAQDGTVVAADDGDYNLRVTQFTDGTVTAAREIDTTLAKGDLESPNVTSLSDGGYVIAWSVDDDSFEGIVVKRYAGNGELLQSTNISTPDADDPSVTALANGQFILSWASENDATDTSTVYTQLFNATGNTSGAAVKVASAKLELEDAQVTVLADNKYIVTWGDTHEDDSGLEELDLSVIKAVVYTNGKPGAVKTLIDSNKDLGEADDMTILPTGDGGYWLTYTTQHYTAGTNGGAATYTSRFQISQVDATGKAVTGSAQTLETLASTYGYASYFDITPVTGGYVFSQVTQGTNTPNRVIVTQLYDTDFKAVGDPVEVVGTLSINGAAITSLPDNDGYVLAWNEYANGGAGVYIQRFDSNGNKIDPSPVQVGAATANEQLWDTPVISVNTDGTIVISWDTQNTTTGSNEIHVQKVSPENVLVGSSTTIITGDDSDNTLNWSGTDDVTLDGGAGTDTAGLTATSGYTFTQDSEGHVVVQSTQNTTLVNIEKVTFGDGTTITVNDGKNDNETGAVVSMEPNSTALKDGGYVVVWEQAGQIHLQQYDKDHDLINNRLLLDSSGNNVLGVNPTIAASDDGGFIVGWTTSSNTLIVQPFDSDSVETGTPITIVPTDDNPNVHFEDVALSVLSNGKIVVSWAEELTENGDTAGSELFVRLYDPVTHAPLGDPVHVDTKTAENAIYAEEPSITNLDNGGFVIAWERETESNGNIDIYLQRYDADGKASGGNVLVNTTTAGEQYGADVTTLNDGSGSLVVTWVSVTYKNGEAVTGNVYMQRYNDKGVKLGGETLVNTATKEIQGEPAITALKGGGYVITWATSDEASRSGDANLYAQIYDKNGAKVGTQMLVTSDDDDLFPVVSATNDGGFVITWEELTPERDGNGNNVSGDIHSQRFDANGNSTSLIGDANDNTITWSGASPIIISGEEGNDILTGGAGNDTLDGGTGNDILNGGAGADTLTGGEGDDIYVVDNLKDQIIENANADTDTVLSTVSWTLGANLEYLTLIGTAAINGTGNELDNVLRGNSAKNTLTGGAGNDTLSGGEGVDTLIGGTGNDTYVVDLLAKGVGTKATVAFEDTIIEKAGEGEHDVLKLSSNSLVNFTGTAAVTLGANLEDLDASATGILAINLTGNAVGNIITGNQGNNILDGKAGIDTLIGDKGDDTYLVDSEAELALVVEEANEGTDTLKIGYNNTSKTTALEVNLSTGNLQNFENVTVTGTGLFNLIGNDLGNTLTGNGSVNTLEGGAGNDVLNGGAGADIMKGGLGNDIYVVDNINDQVIELNETGYDTVHAWVSYTLTDFVEEGQLFGAAALNLTGNDLDNTLTGNAAANTLDGGLGADTLIGGKGNDTYIVDNIGDVVTEAFNEGVDTVKASISYTLTNNVENLILTGSAINGTGNELKNIITGNELDNVLNGGEGIDTLIGGKGNDTYIVDLLAKGVGTKATVALEDTITEKAGEGDHDVLKLSSDRLVNFTGTAAVTLGANLEDLDASATGSLAINLTGNAVSNIITGNDGGNILDGKAGIDTLIGGKGNDTYLLDNVAELALVVEEADEGTDTLRIGYNNTNKTTALDVNLSTGNLVNFENVTVTGTGLFNLTGNDLGNTLIGNSARNEITGGAGDDILDGKNGGDLLSGGAGNDTYYVYSDKDVVVEALNGGTQDTVHVVAYAKNSYTLADNVENAIVDSAAAFSLTGNDLDNALTGNAAANTLDGGLGADTLIGGKGNDIYIVDNIGDVVTEAFNEGVDTVKASIDYTLTSDVENLILTGSAINGTGNELKNIITGNALDNVLDGDAGVDTLIGGAGNDTYIVDLLAKGVGSKATLVLEDTITEKAGEGDHDTLVLRIDSATADAFQGSASITLGANLEDLDARQAGSLNMTLTGNAANNIIYGNQGNNTLNGGAGNDELHAGDGGNNVLIGGLGADQMFGGSGVDTFKFNALNEMGLDDKQDVISFFTTDADAPGAGDKLDFSTLKGYKFVGDEDFSGGAKELRYEADGQGNLVIYGTSNADKVADFSIKLVGVTTLTDADLILS